MAIGVLLAVAAATGYTFNTLLLTLLGAKAGITATKFIFATALGANMLIHWLLYGRVFPQFASLQPALLLAASGLLGYVLGYWTMIRALPLIGPRLLLLILTSQTVMSFLAGRVFLGETPRPASLLFVAMVMAGIVLVILNRQVTEPAGAPAGGGLRRGLAGGIALGFLLAAVQTASQLLSKKALLAGVPPLSANTLRLAVAAAGVFVIAGAASRRVEVKTRHFGRREWALLVAAALTGPVVSVFLSFSALRFVGLGIVSAMLQLSPMLMLVLCRLVFRERIRPAALGGTALAVAGTALLTLGPG
jgi:drug/metabolite transporter (DMT)-like permease